MSGLAINVLSYALPTPTCTQSWSSSHAHAVSSAPLALINVYIFLSAQATIPKVREHAEKRGGAWRERADAKRLRARRRLLPEVCARAALCPAADAHAQCDLVVCASARSLPIGRGGGGRSAQEDCCGECASPREVPLYCSNEQSDVTQLTPFRRFMSVLFAPLFASPRSSSAVLKSVTRRLSSGLPSSVTFSSSAILYVFSRPKA